MISARSLVTEALRRLPTGGVTLKWWDGTEESFGPDRPVATITVHDPSALTRMVRDVRLGVGEAYMDGLIDIEGNLHDLILLANQQRGIFPKALQGPLKALVRGFGITTSQARAKQDIHAHYDLGNDFYRLWLDHDWMQYTCAYYPNAKATLEEAQTFKLNQVARKLILKPGMQVVETGGGWGGLAIFLAKRYKVNVKTYNISHEQIVYAREWAKREKLTDRVEFIEDDYRKATGTADRFVSVGMFEHVGRPQHDQYFATVKRVLKPGGVSLLHTITIPLESATNPWMTKYIFPGSYVPSWREVVDKLPEFGMHLTDVQSLRLHYAMTLDDWTERFEANLDEVRKTFDERFIRMWRLYLVGSAASYRASGLDLHQYVFTHGLNNDLPLNRLSYLRP